MIFRPTPLHKQEFLSKECEMNTRTLHLEKEGHTYLFRYVKGQEDEVVEEMMHLASALRLGTSTNILPEIDPHAINELFLLTQPAHIQKLVGRELSAEDRDVERARYIRGKLAHHA